MTEIAICLYVAILAFLWWLLAGCWPLMQFQWFRHVRGGSWAQCTGMFWGKRWFRIGPYWHRDAIEYWE